MIDVWPVSATVKSVEASAWVADEDDRGATAAYLQQRRGVRIDGADDDSAYGLLQQPGEDLFLFRRLLVGAACQDEAASFGEPVFDAAVEFGVERIGQVEDDAADHEARQTAQSAGRPAPRAADIEVDDCVRPGLSVRCHHEGPVPNV